MLLTASACRGGGASVASSERDQQSFIAVDPTSTSSTDQAIAAVQQRLLANPADETARVELAQLLLQKVRETGDPTLYSKADALLEDVGERNDDLPELHIAKGFLALAQHRFSDAKEDGEKALALAPGNQGAYAVVIDAYNELGEIDKAAEATQAMVDIRPTLPAYSRVSYARELRGDTRGAIAAMREAVSVGRSSGGENVAYVQVLLGDLLLNSGKIDEAEQAYAAAAQSFPGFAAADAGRARVLIAREQFDEAAATLGEVVKRQPFVEYAIAHGDALSAAGRKEEADRAYELVDVIAQLYEANGVEVDRELALFNADHRPDADAVGQARDALEARPNAASHDVLAWALYRNGEVQEAYEQVQLAMAHGSRHPLERFHAAVISRAAGHPEEARRHMEVVLATNPYFSAYLLPEVRKAAAEAGLSFP